LCVCGGDSHCLLSHRYFYCALVGEALLPIILQKLPNLTEYTGSETDQRSECVVNWAGCLPCTTNPPLTPKTMGLTSPRGTHMRFSFLYCVKAPAGMDLMEFCSRRLENKAEKSLLSPTCQQGPPRASVFSGPRTG
jgi:hypothetical protein